MTLVRDLSRDRETLVFRVATALALVHALDDAFLNRQPGVDLDQHALAAAISLAAGVGAIVAFPRLRPGLRSAVALVFGVLATTNGAMHALHIAKDGPAASDLTGVLAVVAGIVLVGLGLAIPWLHRGEGERTRRRRWVNRAIAVAAGFVVLYAGVFPTAAAMAPTHKYREPIPATPTGYEDVEFDAVDGLRLSGWYAPSRNGAAVVLVHGGGGDRTGPLDHARLLRRHGYGVLLYDSRGRGESEGTPNAWGWGGSTTSWARFATSAVARTSMTAGSAAWASPPEPTSSSTSHRSTASSAPSSATGRLPHRSRTRRRPSGSTRRHRTSGRS